MSAALYFNQLVKSLKSFRKNSNFFILGMAISIVYLKSANVCFGATDGTIWNRYTFLPNQSTLIVYSDEYYSNISESYIIEGKFEFYGRKSFFNSAYITDTNAVLIDAGTHVPSQYSLNDIFNLIGLDGLYVNNSTIQFTGKTSDGTDSDIVLTLTLNDDFVSLYGQITPVSPGGDYILMNAVAERKYGGGIGRSDYPYLISTAAHMNTIGLHTEDWASYFDLTDNINISFYKNQTFNIIGYYKSDTDNIPFSGIFNGNNKVITGLSYKSSASDRIGLFGYINGKKSQINNLGIINPDISAGEGKYIGALTGYFSEGKITNCYVTGGHVSGGDMVGGLVGFCDANIPFIDIKEQEFKVGVIKNCISSTDVNGKAKTGGLIGLNECIVLNCSSTADANVTGTNEAGGLVGSNKGIIIDCNSTANTNVTGIAKVGGLAGSNDGLITECISTSNYNVTGTSEIGGMAGSNSGCITDCIFNAVTNVAGNEVIGGLVGTNSKTGIIKGCTSTAVTNISGINEIGGFVGINEGNVQKCKTTAAINVDGTNEIGGFIGLNTGTIQDCNSTAGVTVSGMYEIGAMAGLNNGTIDGCKLTASSNVTGTTEVGGIAGFNNGTIRNSDSISIVAGENQIGGVSGTNYRIVENCISKSTVSGNNNIGGIAGINIGSILKSSSEGSVTGQKKIGGITGINDKGNIKNCSSINTVDGYMYVGGFTGENDGKIINSSSSGSVTGGLWVSGGVGINSGLIQNCLSTAAVELQVGFGGGIAGINKLDGLIESCYSTGAISGPIYIGGLLGFNDGVIIKCYSAGNVKDNYSADNVSDGFGGLIGDSSEMSSALVCFWDTQTSGQTISAGGTGKNTTDMKNINTFTDWGKCSDDSVYWTINQGSAKDYPRLSWENKQGDIITPVLITDMMAGSGTENDPFIIDTAAKMNAAGLYIYEWDKYFLLSANVDMSAYSGQKFNIIGCYIIPFTGVFDGDNHKISNLSYSSPEQYYVGLFGCVDSLLAEVKDVGLLNPTIEAKENVGSLAGYLKEGTVSNCYAENVNVTGNEAAGGLVGYNEISMANCHSTGKVKGNTDIGGLVGINSEGSITGSYSSCVVSGDSQVGGLIGNNSGPLTNCYANNDVDGYDLIGGLVGRNDSSINKCYSSGFVTGTIEVGGLAGRNYAPGSIANSYSSCSVLAGLWVGGLVGVNESTISKCYSSGKVVGTRLSVGGLTAYNSGTITNSFWDTETSGQTTSDDGTGKTTANMKTKATFIAAGWDFTGETANGSLDIWKINQGDYPRLNWQQ
jgi:hypothetical protein